MVKNPLLRFLLKYKGTILAKREKWFLSVPKLSRRDALRRNKSGLSDSRRVINRAGPSGGSRIGAKISVTKVTVIVTIFERW